MRSGRRVRLCSPVVFGRLDSSHHATEGKVLQPAPRLVPLVVILYHHHLYFSYHKLPIQMAHGAGREAAAARARWPARSCADLACPFAPLGRSAKHVAVVAAATYNMMDSISTLSSTSNKFTWACLLLRRRGRRGRCARSHM